MKKQTKMPVIATMLLIGALVVLSQTSATAADQRPLRAPEQEPADKVELFSGKIEEMNVDAKWVKVEKQTYLIGKKTKLVNRDKEIKLEDLHVGTEVHGLAKKNEEGKLMATIIKVGLKPNEAHPGGPEK